MKLRNSKIGLVIASSLAFFAVCAATVIGVAQNSESTEVNALSLPTTVDLKDNTESEIRAYYSYLDNLPVSERRGENLLKNLKYILVNNPNDTSKPAQYFTYNQVRSIYRITDRNWYSSPASGISGYNSSTNKITGFNYSEDPYLYYYYRDDNFTNPHTATATIYSSEGTSQTLLNQEHIWSKSHGFSQDSGVPNAGSDLHHLVAADVAVNKWGHSEEPYGYVATDNWSKTRTNWDNGANAILNNKRGAALNTSSQDTETTVFEPRDEDKGDFARAMFYMVARYNYIGESSFTPSVAEPNLQLVDYFNNVKENCSSSYKTATYGKLGDLLQFHKQDPVITGSNQDFEVHRNNLIYNNYQYTRNPFIDFPEWVDYIWGDNTTGYAKPATDTINGYNQGGGGDTPETVNVTGITVSPSTLSIEANSSSSLSKTIIPSNATDKSVTWTSSNTNVATVNASGLVTGVAEGTAIITATTTDGGYTASCTVTVAAQTGGTYSIRSTDTFNPAFPTAKASINASDTLHEDTTANISIKEKGIYKYQSSLLFVTESSGTPLIYNTTPVNYIKSVTVTYGSNCSASAKAGVVFGTSQQSTYTSTNNKTVAGAGNSDTWNCTTSGCSYFQVSASNSNCRISQIDIVWDTSSSSSDSISLNKASTTLTIGDTETLTATASGTVTWETLDEEIATVNNGTITAVGEGTTTIVARCGTASANCVVTVNAPISTDSVSLDKASLSLAVGNTGTITATASGSVTWTSSDTSVATVSNGEVTGVATGTATITATCGTASATCTVTVSASAPIISADGQYFRKISALTEISDGKYIIVANVSSTYYAMPNSVPSSGKLSGATTTIKDDRIDASIASGLIVSIAKSGDYYTINNGENSYLSYESSTNLGTASTGDKILWSVTTSESKGAFDFANKSDTSRHLRFSVSSGTNKFGAYSQWNVSYYNLDLYKEEQATSYAYTFMNAFTCDNGAHEPSFTIMEGTTYWSWSLLGSAYSALDQADREELTGATANESGNTIEQAVARYDKVASHWKYENFMSRSITGLNNRTSFISSDNELFIVIISTSSIVSVTAVGLYMLLRKRKEQ